MRNNTFSLDTSYHKFENFSKTKAINHVPHQEQSKNSSKWFETFLKFTNQKSITANTIQNLFFQLQENNVISLPLSILDIGCGEGELAFKILNTWKGTTKSINYHGIDSEPRFVKNTNDLLTNLGIKGKAIQGNCFDKDLDLLPNKADILLISNVAYYAPDIPSFIDSLLSKGHNNTILLSIHESSFSLPNSLRNKYGATVDTQTAYKISTHLKNSSINFHEFSIHSTIKLPQDFEQQTQILLTAISNQDPITPNAPLYDLKMLLEFIVQTPLEELEHKSLLQSYVYDVAYAAQQNQGQLKIESSVAIVIPDNFKSKVENIINGVLGSNLGVSL